MKFISLAGVAAACLVPTIAIAQSPNISDSIHAVQLGEVVHTASGFKAERREVAPLVLPITQSEIRWASPQNTAALLEQTGSIFVQRSQMGGGSPVIRGFEASRVLLTIDGVRMNNAIYRTGHLQNAITIDNNVLDRVEVLFGPASTLYGSDALGGVVAFFTKDPALSKQWRKPVSSGGAMLRYSSANEEGTAHADFSIGGQRLASLTSITYSTFGDLRQGSTRSPYNPEFGNRYEYVARRNGGDSIIRNSDVNVQKQSGYQQIDLLQKFRFKQDEHNAHTLNLQFSNTNDVPRYDRLTEYRNGKLRYAEWYYGPQQRFLAAYNFNHKMTTGFFQSLRASLNYQNIEESRHQRNLGSTSRQHRVEKVNVVGYNVDAQRHVGRSDFNVGLDGQFNFVNSTAYDENINTGAEKALDTRYPSGGSRMSFAALYAQYHYRIRPRRLIANAGLRLNYVTLHADFDDTTFFNFPYQQADQKNTALSGNAGLVWLPAKRWKAAINLSSGFRAPNVDDLAKVFESAGSTQLIVPNPDLRPEYTYNADLSIAYQVDDNLKLEASGFYTVFRDAIVTDRFQLNGQDSITYNGQTTVVVASQNKAKAYLYGFNAALTAHLVPRVTLYSSLNYTYGRFVGLNDVEVPLDHIPPVHGKSSIAYEQGRFTGEVFVLYNGWKTLREYNPSGEDNLQYATALGMPGWCTINLRTGISVHRYLYVQAALENLMDVNYRQFASGISAPGRNFVLTLRSKF